MQWPKDAVRKGALQLISSSPGSPYCSGDVCGFLAMAWRSDIPSTPTLAANVPISGLLRRGGSMGGGEHRRMRDRGERARQRACIRVFLDACVYVTRPQTSDIPFAMT